MTETIHDIEGLKRWNAEADDLWLVTAVIQPFKLDAVTLALEASPACRGATVTECRGFGGQKLSRDGSQQPLPDGGAASRGDRPTSESRILDYSKRLRIECVVAAHDDAVTIARVVARAAHTGREGDGKVFVSRLVGMIGVRTFALDQLAL